MTRRVEGTEKFRSEDGAEAILQLRADRLGGTDPPDAFGARRAAPATGERRHRRATPVTLAAESQAVRTPIAGIRGVSTPLCGIPWKA